MSRSVTRRLGFTLLELVLVLVLLAIVALKAYDALDTTQTAVTRETRQVWLEEQGRRVLRQIAYAVMGANRETLAPEHLEAYSTEHLRYQVNLGIEDGEVVWSDPEAVAMEVATEQVYWTSNPDSEKERRIIWTSLVAPYLEGEIPNGIDDNGNGIIDEKGLSFVVDRNSVQIRLTLERVLPDGEILTNTVETTVTCRNVTESDA